MKENIITLAITTLLGLSLVGCQANIEDLKGVSATSEPSSITDVKPTNTTTAIKNDNNAITTNNNANNDITTNVTTNSASNRNEQDIYSSEDDNLTVLQKTPSFIYVSPTPIPLTNNFTNTPFIQSEKEDNNGSNEDLPTPKPLIVAPKEWIDPVFKIIRREIGGYFRIMIENKANYIGENYEMKAECISHPFNESLKYQTDWTEIIVVNTSWKPVDSNYYLAYLCKADYALPENMEKYPIIVGMKISYIISIRKNDFIKEYPITVTVE